MATSTTLTVRNLPPEVVRAVREHARRNKTSLSRAAADLLTQATGKRRGAGRPPVRFDDLDGFAGKWTKEDAAEFDATLAEQRRIDPKDWE